MMKRFLPLAIVSIIGGLVAHVGVFYFIRIEVPSPTAPPADLLQVQYAGDLGIRANPALREQALLQDSAPLFMPTRWNLVSQMDDVASLREATEVFSQYPPSLTLPESSPGSFPALPTASRSPDSALPDSPSFYLSRFGREPIQQPSGLPSGLSASARRLGFTPEEIIASSALPDSLQAQLPQTLWAPLQIYLHLVDGLPLGRPIVAESSGFSDWDQAVQDFIGSLDYYRSLKSGYYRITVFP